MNALYSQYVNDLKEQLDRFDWQLLDLLVEACQELITHGRRLYICGNGGSAGNAMHLANDFLYGVSPKLAKALKVEALPANSAVLTCLGNDIGYENIFSRQLEVKGEAGDVLLVLSGSGNSANILNALEMAKQKQMISFAILGYDGGTAKKLADRALHFPVNDMQIAEDLQMVMGHLLMRRLCDEVSC